MAYGRGLGVVPFSSLTYSLGGAYTTFQATVGLDDVVVPNGSVVFQVFTDNNVLLFDSGLVTSLSPAQVVDVNVTGRSTLRLVVTDGGDGSDYDHADWARSRLLKGGSSATTTSTTTTVAPPTTTTTPAPRPPRPPPPPTTTTTHHRPRRHRLRQRPHPQPGHQRPTARGRRTSPTAAARPTTAARSG